ncbi:MAG: shikimate kinase [Oscillospiraceae bacterium]|nr:shikimate kinase [Oscillospiraceae bacterium]
MDNIVLIGMPGCGKTSVGQLLAAELGFSFVDTDELVEREENRTIPAIFSAEGEGYFRDLETRAAKCASGLKGAVIATGGGMVLRPENMEALGETGTVIFIDRAPEDIAGETHSGRPLIGNDRERVFSLYHARIDLYRRYAGHIVGNCVSPRQCMRDILQLLDKERTV